jgi:2,3-dihydroxybiphenyl 1,2-dioxygenase
MCNEGMTMMTGLSLGYLVFEVSNPDRWSRFSTTILGLMPAEAGCGGEMLAFRCDDAAYRLLLRQGGRDDLAALGWSAATPAAFEAVLERLQGMQVAIEEQPVLAAKRNVVRMITFRDPDGTLNEVVEGLPEASTPFTSAAMPGGFNAGMLGIGHAVLASHDPARLEVFYAAALGMGVTERLRTKVGPIPVQGSFLHANSRHHSLAVMSVPSRKRLNHFMLEARRLADVGVAYDRARQAGVPIMLEIGQHPEPDSTCSFYGETPSGFDFEIGAGTQVIVPEGWETHRQTIASRWGHHPTLRAKLRALSAMLLRPFNDPLKQAA